MTDVATTALRASYGATTVLHGIDLAVGTGTCTAVLGPSGSGKSTLLRVLAGLHRADTGVVRIGDRVVDDGTGFVPPERRGIGLVPQSGALFPHLPVHRNVAFGLRGRPAAEVRRRVAELVEMAGLTGLEQRMPHQLSGGQRQRVALARALAPDPALVLLDEPFSALDASLRVNLRAEVTAILRAAGATAVLVTHDQAEAMSMADRIAVLHEGRVVQEARPAELYAAPATPWVGGFLGDATLLPGSAEGDVVTCALGSVPRVPGPDGTVTVLLRPEHLAIAAAGPGLSARVVAVDFRGHDAVATVVAGDQVLRVRVEPTAMPTVGASVAVVAVAPARTYPAEA